VLRLLEARSCRWNTLYNVGGGGSVSLHELVGDFARAAEEMGLSAPAIRRYPEIPPSGPRHLELDVRRLQAALDWTPRWTLREGLKQYLVACSQMHGDGSEVQADS